MPALKLGAGEPWEQGMKLRTWLKQVETIAGTIADSFGAYVNGSFDGLMIGISSGWQGCIS